MSLDRMAMSRTMAFVMAGGEGTRLRPLTEHVPKPALRIGERCRLIDFVLSNLHNSGIDQVYVLLQYRGQVLADHLADVWPANRADGHFVEPVWPETMFAGTADAVRQGLARVDDRDVDTIAVFAADHVYRMDVRQMIAFHRDRDADATIAAIPVPRSEANRFGVMRVGRCGRVLAFEEKPAWPAPAPDDPAEALVSMGNYLFRPAVLREALRAAAERGEHDFGHHVLPRLVRSGAVFAYDFRNNRVPGLHPCEEPAYWRDVGTRAAYEAAQRDVAGLHPRLRLDNPCWSIRGADPRVRLGLQPVHRTAGSTGSSLAPSVPAGTLRGVSTVRAPELVGHSVA